MDHVPLLAIIGQVPQETMNTNYFQEMDEVPLFSDVSVYNRTVTTAEQIPYVINQAIREAYRQKGLPRLFYRKIWPRKKLIIKRQKHQRSLQIIFPRRSIQRPFPILWQC